MVCSLCNCSGHNKATCPLRASAAEMRVSTELCAMLPALKTKGVSKPLVDPHMAWMREFKRMSSVTKEVNNGLEGLYGCKNIFLETKIVKAKKHLKTCSACGEKGHNSRTCSNICMPCPPPKSYCFAGRTAKQAVAMARMMDCTPAY